MTTRHLGSLGTVRAVTEEVTFDYFGQTIRANPAASDLAFMEFLEASEGIDVDEENPAARAKAEMESVKILMTYLREQIHPQDWPVFWNTAKARGQTTMDLMLLSQAITEAVSNFPIGRPADSSGGPQKTPQKSTADSSSLGKTRRSSSDSRAALTLLQGRPDLQQVVLAAEQARATA